jgi:polyhydroxybutyrate depolymerase
MQPVAAHRPPVPSPGCAGGTNSAPGTATDLTMEAAGKSRVYRQYLPTDVPPDRPLPLVVDLHGLLETREFQASMTGWEGLAAKEKFIVLTPQGLGAIPNWQSNTSDDNPDTIFLSSLLDKVKHDLCVDETRVYVGGISNGGLESSILVCKIGHEIAAVGLVSGITVPSDCPEGRPMPVIVFWGKKDCVLPFYGGLGPCLVPPKNGEPATVPTSKVTPAPGLPLPVEDSVAQWAERNGCAPDPTVEPYSEHIEKRVYNGCRDGDAVELYVISNGGHTWPGSQAILEVSKASKDSDGGVATTEVDATAAIWAFYQRFQVPA